VSIELPVPEGVGLAGFASRAGKVWPGAVDGTLEANLLLIAAGEDSILLISIDCAYANEITRRLRAADVASIPFAVLASHTHYAPSLMPEYPGLGVMHTPLVDLWEELLTGGIRELFALPPQEITFRRSRTPHLATRRRRRQLFIRRHRPFVRRGVIMAPAENLQTPATVDSFIGDCLEAHLWSIAVHPTGYHNVDALTSEYPGCVRSVVRSSNADKDVHVLFGQGASGDIRQPFYSLNPRRVGAWRFLSEVIPSGFRPSFVRSTKNEWSTWAGELAAKVELEALRARDSVLEPIVDGKFTVGRATASASEFFKGSHPIDEIEVIALLVGSNGTIFVNAEVTSRLAEQLQSADTQGRDWVVFGCVNECVGYLATLAEMNAGGYECSEWPRPFGLAVTPRSAAPERLVALCARAIADAT